MDVAISGASGLIGTALVRALEDAGHRAIRLVRGQPAAGADEIRWQPANEEIDAASLDGVDAIVNLSGAGIGDHRWTPEYKRVLVTSRTDSTSLLATTAASLPSPPKVLLSGSAIGYYGSQGDTVLTEESPPGTDFLAELTVDWEAAAKPAVEAGIRTAFLRTGIVMSRDGGALPKLLPLFKLFVGGRFGSGTQYMSWITIDDEVGAIMHLLDADIAGPVNLTAPEPVTNARFAEILGKVLGRPSVLPVPSFGPRLVLGADRADALLFDSMRVMPEVLGTSGYAFTSADLETGLRSVLGR
ncbi:MAG: TIGR01777 family oxidoreductase [Acidimicrobiales bacterium]